MWFHSILNPLKFGSAQTGQVRKQGPARKRPPRCRLSLEALEDRTLLSSGLSFAAPVDINLGAGKSPQSIATGDFRGIGIQDLAVADSGSNDVAIFLGNGNGTFRLAETITVGRTPSFVTVGDFNGDGIPDLAVADSGSNEVSILLGHGDGSFDLPHSYSVGKNPQAIAVGHFTGQGSTDLAVANKDSNNVSILLGNGDGTFHPGATLAVGGAATSVVAADFNGDGNQDLTVTVYDSTHPATLPGHVSIWLGTGEGTFLLGQNYLVGTAPGAITVGDFNGDGNPDLAVANVTSDSVSILLGKGDGTFRVRTYQVGGQPTTIAVGDFNGDGIPDVITANRYATVSVLSGQGDGTFAPSQDFWAGADPVSLAIGDFNGDGKQDVAVAQLYSSQVSILLNNGPQPEDGVTVVRDIPYYDGPFANPQRENLDVYLPASGTNVPVVFMVYGGIFAIGNKSKLAYLARSYARQGLAVVTPNYRLNDGSAQQVIHPGAEEDIARALAWTYNHIAEYGGDPNNIFLMGHSAGASIVNELATDKHYLAAQGISTDMIRGVISFSGSADFSIREDYAAYFGDAQQRWEASPLRFVDGTQPPFLLLDAQFDNPGLPDQAQTFSNALLAANDQVELHQIADRNHIGNFARSARPGDPAREFVLQFIAAHILPPQSKEVHAGFDLSSVTGGPFASDRWTIADPTQNTGRRVNLPLPDPDTHPSDYQDTQVLNTLDGFNLQPRLSIPFDGPIDLSTVNSQTIFLVSLGDTLNPDDHGGQVVGINQVVWDPDTNTLHVTADQLLDQHARYALIVTDGVLDTNGNPVAASEEFRHFRQDLAHTGDPVLRFYRKELNNALDAVRHLGVSERDIVTASVFTTESATAVLEKIRDQIAATPEPADFNLGPDGSRTVFALDDITGITFNEQVGDNPTKFNAVNLNLGLARNIPGAIGEIAFGKYLSPDYEVHPGEYIPAVGTRTGTPAVQGVNEVYFNLYLPSGPEPASGWPVAIFGHGTGNNKNETSLFVAATLAEHGIATIAINDVGHGFGPLSTLTVSQSGGASQTFSAGGRGFDQNGDHVIDNAEGFSAAPPYALVGETDGMRQTVADLMQLVRVIEVGVDVHGDGSQDLDPSRIYYVGYSLGGLIGTSFLALEPSVQAGVLDVASGSRVEATRLGLRRSALGAALAARTPSLLNTLGVTSIDGVAVTGPFFNENLPLRDGIPLTVRLADGTQQVIQGPVINTVPGAMAIQEVLDNMEWVAQTANPVAYAPHLRKDPLAGVNAKSVLLMFGKGDEVGPNPAEAAIVRAGDLADRTTFYRNDLAIAEDPTVPKNPHQFMLHVELPGLAGLIARGAQEQIATFFESDGTVIIHPEPSRFFETPIVLPLPEDLNYIP
jgi:acetyl esterase/lipase